MYIKQGLVFEKSTGALFGFMDLGDINNQLDEFEASLKQNTSMLQRPIAKTMIVFMFKGFFTNIALPYAQFAATSLTGADLFPLLWKVIERLTRTGCCILGVTCDGGSPNQRLFQLHQMPGDPKNKLIYKAVNPYADKAEDILFLQTLLICLRQFEIVFKTLVEICGYVCACMFVCVRA